jgi:hypothetical protein
LGLFFIHAPTHDGVRGVHVRRMEDCNVEQVKDPYVLQLELEYKFLRDALHEEVVKFDSLKRQHEKAIAELTNDITKKFFEYQNAKVEAKKYLKQKHDNYQENGNE